MTTLNTVRATCCSCGASFERVVVGSTYVHGPPDLDLREGPLARDCHRYLVAPCEWCGFPAAEEDEDEPEDLRRRLGTAHRELPACGAADVEWAALKRRGQIERGVGRDEEAGTMLLSAAWCADDARDDHEATRLRLDAAEAFSAAIEAGGHDEDQPGACFVRLADVLRRAGVWDGAAEATTLGLAEGPDPFVAALLRFERELIEKRGRGAHSLGEVEASGLL